MRNQRDKRNYIIIGLCAILVIMGVGYASFSTLLTINGTANISNSWCLGFDNTKTNTMQVTKGVSTGANPTGSMSYSGTACSSTLQPNASLSATFHQPGDEIEYTLTIKNASTVTAAIKSILVDNESVTSNTTRTKDNITYVINMPLDTTLSANEETTMTIIAKVQNETPISGVYTGETKTINVKINAEQDDGNGGLTPTPPAFTGTIYRYTNLLFNGLPMNGEATLWYSTLEDYASVEEAYAYDYVFSSKEYCENEAGENNCTSGTVTLSIGEYTTDASTLNKNHYLKHDVVNDIITSSYVCFVYNNAEHCMKGGDGGESFATNTQIIKDFQTFNNLPTNSSNPGCRFNSGSSHCSGGGFYGLGSDSSGNLYVNRSSGGSCYVQYNGNSYCNE